MDSPRVTLVHDWLTGMRGGEKVLECFCRLWPGAPLYTVLNRGGVSGAITAGREIHASWLNRLPGVGSYYRYLLPLMPGAVRWKLPASDVVLSSSHCVAKGVTPPAGAVHVSYCYTPMRYAWHLRDAYFGDAPRRGLGALKSAARSRLLARLRDWDRRTADTVDHFVAISETTRQRIRECYGRDAAVIYPPVDTDFYTPDASVSRTDEYLVVSACAPYKRLDLAISACRKLGRRLTLIGTGQDATRLRALAGGDPLITFLGWQSDEVIRDRLRRCKALLFPGVEDFGIVPVEAMACGTPVVALGQGGAAETVVPPGPGRRATGVWFGEQTLESLCGAIETFEALAPHLDPADARARAEEFARPVFEGRIAAFVAGAMASPARRAA